MGIAGSTALGAAGGALVGGALFATLANTRPPELFAVGTVAAGAGALTGLAAGIAARRGAGPAQAALIGAAIGAVIPAGLAIGAATANDDTGWRRLGFGIMGMLTGAGVAGGGAALLGHALLRR